MLNQETKGRRPAHVVVSTQDDRFYLMVDAVLGDMVESVRPIEACVSLSEGEWTFEHSDNQDMLAIVDISPAHQLVKMEIDRLKKLSPRSRIILVNRDEPEALEAFAHRVSAIVPYAAMEHTLVHVAHVALADMSVVPGTVLKFCKAKAGKVQADPDLDRLRSLSLTESRVMLSLAEGLSNKQIARVISISDNTVRIHVRKIFLKLGVQNRTQAALLASRYRHTGVLLEKVERLIA